MDLDGDVEGVLLGSGVATPPTKSKMNLTSVTIRSLNGACSAGKLCSISWRAALKISVVLIRSSKLTRARLVGENTIEGTLFRVRQFLAVSNFLLRPRHVILFTFSASPQTSMVPQNNLHISVRGLNYFFNDLKLLITLNLSLASPTTHRTTSYSTTFFTPAQLSSATPSFSLSHPHSSYRHGNNAVADDSFTGGWQPCRPPLCARSVSFCILLCYCVDMPEYCLSISQNL